MKAFNFLKCEVEFFIDKANDYLKKHILEMMASDKGLIISVECIGTDVISIQLATREKVEPLIDSFIYEYLLSTVMLKWVKGMKIISLSFSEQQPSISQLPSVEECINSGKCTEECSFSVDEKSESSTRQEFPEQPETKTLPDLIYFDSDDTNSNLEQVKKLYNSKLSEKINFEYEQAKRTSSQIGENSTASEPPLEVEEIGTEIINPEDSVSNIESSNVKPKLKITTRTLQELFLKSDFLNDWAEEKAVLKKTVNAKDHKGIDRIINFSAIALELIDFEGNKISKIKSATKSLREDNDCKVSISTATTIVSWVYDVLEKEMLI